jgi:tetratricopeptide (TPR) repeat protein
LRSTCFNAEGSVVRFAEASGIVRLDGAIQDHSIDEKVESKKDQCQKIQGGKTVKYACTKYVRTAKARLQVSMNVLDGSGRTLAAETYADGVERKTEGTDQEPPAIDGEAMLSQLRGAAVESFAKMIVPYRVTTTKPWFKCGDLEDKCEAALAQLLGGNFGAAIGLLEQAVDSLRSSGDPEALAAAWWGLTLAHEFSGSYEQARASLNEAIAANPNEKAFPSELASIDEEEESRRQLAKQQSGR